MTESEKAEFHTPAIPNMTRNCVKHNSVENISQDLVQPTTSDTEVSTSFDFKSEEREEITDVPAPAPTPAPALQRGLRNKVLTLQDPESQQERTLKSQPIHLVIFTYK